MSDQPSIEMLAYRSPPAPVNRANRVLKWVVLLCAIAAVIGIAGAVLTFIMLVALRFG